MVIGRVLRSPSRLKDLCLILSSLFIFYLLLHHHPPPPPPTTFPSSATTSPTSLRHLLFSIAASSRSFPARRPYLRLWHRPNSTRTVVFLDRPISPSPSPSDPPVLLSAPFPGRSAARIARVVKEAVLLNQSDVRWFVFGDDDTVFFTANLVRTLSRYDHDQWYYVGSLSESYGQNLEHSFEMAYGGGGFAISHSLARVLAGVLDSCLIRYAHLYGSDARIFSCLAELGVGLTNEPGFHQVDIRGDIFGLLSAHPLSPLLSLHHFEALEPIFPNMTRNQAFEHLFKAVNVDPGRILQQTVCYDPLNMLTVSVSWGYAIQVFEGNYLLPELLQLQNTFRPWRRKRDIISNLYMFNSREFPNDPCKRPLVFFMETVASDSKKVWTDYTRHIIGNCSRSPELLNLENIKVFSQKPDFEYGEVKVLRRQCCDILPSFSRTMVISIRQCGVGELISMQT